MNGWRFKQNNLQIQPDNYRGTYLTGIELRTSTPTTYVAQHQRPTYLNDSPQGLVWRFHSPRLEAPFVTFGGSIHYIWRLHSLRLEAPFTTFGGSKRDCHSRCAPVWCSSSGRTSCTTLVIASTKIDLWVSHLFTTRNGVFQVYKGSDSSPKKL